MGTKGLCELQLSFLFSFHLTLFLVDMVSAGEFLLQVLQTKDAPILLDGNIFNSKQLGKYTESTEIVCSGDPVDFKFRIDFPQRIDQNIENFHVRALNGRRLSFENWLKSIHFINI